MGRVMFHRLRSLFVFQANKSGLEGTHSRGSWSRPHCTRSKFLPHPHPLTDKPRTASSNLLISDTASYSSSEAVLETTRTQLNSVLFLEKKK